MDEDEDFLDSLLSLDLDDSSDTAAENEIDINAEFDRIIKIGDKVWESFPKQPAVNSNINKLLYYIYFSCHYFIIYNKINGENMAPQYSDSDVTVREKSHFIFLREQWKKCKEMVNELYEKINGIIYNKLLEKVENKHVLVWFLEKLKIHKELHTRRLKIDPSTSRTKTTDVTPVYNAVTEQRYDCNNEDHKVWRMLIINPLPSDYNYHNIDPVEGDMGVIDDQNKNNYKIGVQTLKEAGKYDIPDPFYIIVTPQWDKIFRILHFLKHFEDYFFVYVNNGIINEMDHIEHLNIKDTWEYLLKEYANFMKSPSNECTVATTFNNFSREKKTSTQLVFRMSVLRDVFKVLIKF